MKPERVLTVLVLVLFGALLFAIDEGDDARTESARYKRQLDSLAAVSARIDTVYARDTLRLWRTLRDLDTLTVTVHAWKHDTVKVVEYVARTEVAAQECKAAILTCEERVSIRDQRILTLDSLNRSTERALTAAERRGRRERIVYGLGGLAIGWLAKP